MHIGFITSEYPHQKTTHAAGIATSIKNLAIALVKQDVKVSVYVYHQKEDAVYKDEGVDIHLIKHRHYKFFSFYKYRKHVQRYVREEVKKCNIDLLEAPDWTGITAFMHFRVPLVIRFHGSDAYFCKLENRKQKFKNFLFEKLALKNANAYIAPTTYAGDVTRKIFGLNPEKIKTIHYGLELSKFVNKNPEHYNEKTILYIGTLIRKKGVLELTKIFNTIVDQDPDVKLILIGNDAPDIKTGSESTYKLMQTYFSDEAKKNVDYLGKVPYSKVKSYIEQAHVCVFPSFAETLGMVTIEAMALQKPVVNTNIGWALELIDNGVNGYLVHPKATEAYSLKILELLNNKSLCSKIGKEAYTKVESTFNIDKQAKTNITYYKRVIETF